MSHQPTQADVAADLYRCVYFTLEKDSFNSPNFIRFMEHARKILKNFDSIHARKAKELISKAMDEKREKIKRQEDLLTASLILK